MAGKGPPAAEVELEVSHLRERVARLEADQLTAVEEAVKEERSRVEVEREEERRRVEVEREEERMRVVGEREEGARLLEETVRERDEARNRLRSVRESQGRQAELVKSLQVITTCCHDNVS